MYTAILRDDIGETTVRGFTTIAEAVDYAENSGAIEFTIVFNEGRRKHDEQSRTKGGGESEPRVQ